MPFGIAICRDSGDASSGIRNSLEYVGTAPPSAIPVDALRSSPLAAAIHAGRSNVGSRSWSAISETSVPSAISLRSRSP
jgi:hypothetical protein